MMQLIKKLSEPRILLFLGVAYTIFITVISLLPASEIPNIKISNADKIAHILIHAVLSLMWLWFCFTANKGQISGKNISVVLVLCFLYGLGIEAGQKWFVTSRTFDLYDVVANCLGSIFGLILYIVISSKLSRLLFGR